MEHPGERLMDSPVAGSAQRCGGHRLHDRKRYLSPSHELERAGGQEVKALYGLKFAYRSPSVARRAQDVSASYDAVSALLDHCSPPSSFLRLRASVRGYASTNVLAMLPRRFHHRPGSTMDVACAQRCPKALYMINGQLPRKSVTERTRTF